MRVEELRQLVHWLECAGIGTLEIESSDYRLRLVLEPAGSPPTPVTIGRDAGSDARDVIAAEFPGIFLVQHPQRTTPVIPLGEAVRAGDIVGLIRIGAVLAPVIARKDGTLANILAVPESLVGVGTPLIEIA
jgi:acetyl-CoA carboxylase biotin carboxyl carrier protein